MYKKTVKVKPQGNDLAMVTRIIGLAIKKNGIFKIGRAGFLDAAKPSAQVGEGHTSQTLPWSDKFVDDVKRTLTACQVRLDSNSAVAGAYRIFLDFFVLPTFLPQRPRYWCCAIIPGRIYDYKWCSERLTE